MKADCIGCALVEQLRKREAELFRQSRLVEELALARQTERDLTQLACHDGLTGLPNRLLLNDRLDQAMARTKRNDGRIGLLLLDLDNFKRVNDTLGHAAGDRLLQAVAGRLVRCVRAEDTIARLAGDEFCLLLNTIVHAVGQVTLPDVQPLFI